MNFRSTTNRWHCSWFHLELRFYFQIKKKHNDKNLKKFTVLEFKRLACWKTVHVSHNRFDLCLKNKKILIRFHFRFEANGTSLLLMNCHCKHPNENWDRKQLVLDPDRRLTICRSTWKLSNFWLSHLVDCFSSLSSDPEGRLGTCRRPRIYSWALKCPYKSLYRWCTKCRSLVDNYGLQLEQQLRKLF